MSTKDEVNDLTWFEEVIPEQVSDFDRIGGNVSFSTELDSRKISMVDMDGNICIIEIRHPTVAEAQATAVKMKEVYTDPNLLQEERDMYRPEIARVFNTVDRLRGVSNSGD
jgi:hypothetical protein